MRDRNDRLLRYSLRGNAAFSALSGATALAAAEPLARGIGLGDPAILAGLGAQLLVFAGLLLALASRPRIRLGLAAAVVAADVLWVVGTVPVVLSGALNAVGDWTAVAIADVVAVFALLQLLGIRRLQRGAVAPAV